MILSFSVFGVPAPQGSFKAVRSQSTGRAVLLQSCARTMPWRSEVAAAAINARGTNSYWPAHGPVELAANFYLPRPSGHRGKRGLRPSAPTLPSKKPDLSKLVRAIEDALIGIAYHDDAQIVRLDVEKRYADDGVVPGLEIELKALESV